MDLSTIVTHQHMVLELCERSLLQKINCFNFGSINAQKNKDRSVYVNNLRPHLPSESKLSSTNGNSKQYFTSNRMA